MVKKAIEAVAAGMSLRKAAKKYSMSKSVLHRYTKMTIPAIYVKKFQSDINF